MSARRSHDQRLPALMNLLTHHDSSETLLNIGTCRNKRTASLDDKLRPPLPKRKTETVSMSDTSYKQVKALLESQRQMFPSIDLNYRRLYKADGSWKLYIDVMENGEAHCARVEAQAASLQGPVTLVLVTLKYEEDEEDCNLQGSEIMNWITSLSTPGSIIHSIEVVDDSQLIFKAGRKVSILLTVYRKLRTGLGWYERYGFFPASGDDATKYQQSFSQMRAVSVRQMMAFLWHFYRLVRSITHPRRNEEMLESQHAATFALLAQPLQWSEEDELSFKKVWKPLQSDKSGGQYLPELGTALRYFVEEYGVPDDVYNAVTDDTALQTLYLDERPPFKEVNNDKMFWNVVLSDEYDAGLKAFDTQSDDKKEALLTHLQACDTLVRVFIRFQALYFTTHLVRNQTFVSTPAPQS